MYFDAAAATERPPRSRWRRRLGCTAAMLFATAFVTWFVPKVQHAREAARSLQCMGHLNQLHVAFHNYHDTYGCFPPAYVADANGKPIHSWRVLMLPFIDEVHLYEKYRFDEPWNGPNNRRLANQLNWRFHCE